MEICSGSPSNFPSNFPSVLLSCKLVLLKITITSRLPSMTCIPYRKLRRFLHVNSKHKLLRTSTSINFILQSNHFFSKDSSPYQKYELKDATVAVDNSASHCIVLKFADVQMGSM